jgi:RNA polymerase sigma-70 factor (ECF subfamily)
MATAGKTSVFDTLQGFLSDSAGALSYPEAATRLGLTEPATRKTVQRLRQRYRELLREEVALTVAAPHEVEEELKYLLDLFSPQ